MDERRPRILWRVLLLAVLAVLTTGTAIGAAFETSTTCSGETACTVFHVLVAAAFFGGWVALLVAVAGWAVLRWVSPRRAAWPANAALAVSVVLLCALPAYDFLRDGLSGVTSQGRARQHADDRARIVGVLDATARAVRPHASLRVVATPGTLEPNSTDACERETYALALPAGAGGVAALLRDVAAHWRTLGFEVSVREAAFVHARDGGEVSYSAAEDPVGTVRLSGAGPCRKPA